MLIKANLFVYGYSKNSNNVKYKKLLLLKYKELHILNIKNIYIYIYSCDGKAEFSPVITPVFSVKLCFRNHSNKLICFLITYYRC